VQAFQVKGVIDEARRRRLQLGLLQEQTGGAVVPGKEGKEHYPGRLDRLGPGEVNTLEALVSQILAGPQVRPGGREGKKPARFSKADMLLIRKAGMRKRRGPPSWQRSLAHMS